MGRKVLFHNPSFSSDTILGLTAWIASLGSLAGGIASKVVSHKPSSSSDHITGWGDC